MKIEGRQSLVIGAGRSGCSAARFLVARGARVRVVDRRSIAAHAGLPAGVEFHAGDDTRGLDGVDLVIPSPGVAREHPLLVQAVARGIPVCSEVELAARFLNCPLLAVTGTNGKSTTTVLLGAMIAASGADVFVGGNLGTPLTAALDGGRTHDAAVVEVSSFQLDWVETLRPCVAVWLNLTPDHQDRYDDPADYAEAKVALFARQSVADVAVLNRDDPAVWQRRHRIRASVLSFGRSPVAEGACLDGDDVVLARAGREERYSLRETALVGAHNRENMQAAVTAASAFGVPGAAIRAALRDARPLPHRLTAVGERGGVRFYDDSKGTNVGAVDRSVRSFSGGVVLLLGGHDKGGNFRTLRPLLRDRVERVVCFGAAGPDIAAQLTDAARCDVVGGLADAVRAATAGAKPGNTVLLSPGCASFDEFRDYAERGQCFRKLVEAL